MSIKVFGHLIPDTDATCAAIVYAWYLSNHKNLDAEAFVLGDLNKETQFVLKHFGQKTPETLTGIGEGEVVVLVDTNNPEEILPDFKHASLLEIVDHHKLVGGIATSSPVSITMRPVACTTTIIWQMIVQENHTDIPVEVAGLMLAAILSDTLNFTSPTTTDADKEAAKALAIIAKEDSDKLADGMFEAKSDLSGMSTKDILLMDGKIFKLADKKVRISCLETTKPGSAMAMESELVKEIESLKKEEGLDAMFFFIVDILTSSSQLLLASSVERVVAERGFDGQIQGNVMSLPGVVSRKKQMVPAIEKGLGS
jgi:manganese-dependent inorganic pyrophosphatase